MKRTRIIISASLIAVVMIAAISAILFGILYDPWIEETNMTTALYNISMYTAIVLLAFAVAAALFLPLILRNVSFGGVRKLIIGAAIFLLVYFIAVLLSPADASLADKGIGPGLSRMINGGIIMVYISLVLIVAVIIYTIAIKRTR